jgi:hypothetical protein
VRITNHDSARRFADSIPVQATWVSKADEGASSSNIRVLKGRNAVRQHIDLVFRRGIRVRHCGGHATMQRNYVMLQEFIPHDTTSRVNRVGDKFAIFRRFNYPGRNVAQTGSVKPVMALDANVQTLLEFAHTISTAPLESKWIALDILRTADGWRLLETSLGWPWPSPGTCDDAPFFALDGTFGTTRYQWRDMWELMLDEYEAGVFRA